MTVPLDELAVIAPVWPLHCFLGPWETVVGDVPLSSVPDEAISDFSSWQEGDMTVVLKWLAWHVDDDPEFEHVHAVLVGEHRVLTEPKQGTLL